MRQLLLLLCCIIFCNSAFAQKNIRYSGYVQMPNDPLVSYYLELNIDGNRAHGYSITGYKNGNRLKAAVEGYFTTPSDLYIKETGSLDDPRVTGATTYCYFSAHLKLTIMMNGRKRWNGPFESKELNGTPCPMGAGGVMTIMDNAPPLEDVPKPQQPNIAKVEIPKPPVHHVPRDTPKPVSPKPVQPFAVQKPRDTAKPIIIMKPASPEPRPVPPPQLPDSCQRTYEWGSPEFVFDVWDGYTVDGDVVSVRMNGRNFLEHAKLSEKKEHFSIPLSHGLNVLYIYLHEEGTEPPNTPNLTLYDGDRKYELAVSGNPGEIVRICVWRK
jgi:hypothetical protein